MKKTISKERLKEHYEWEEQLKKDNIDLYKQLKKKYPQSPNELYLEAERLRETFNERILKKSK